MATATAFLVLLLIAFGVPATFGALARVFGPRRPDEIKSAAFESGIEPRIDARRRFSVGYYRAALAAAGFHAAAILLADAALDGAGILAIGGAGLLFAAVLVRVLDQGVRSWD